MAYCLHDFKRLCKDKVIWIMTACLFLLMIADPISVYIQASQSKAFMDYIGFNPFQFWLLINSASWGNQVYNVIFWLLPALISGTLYYSEQKSSMEKLLIIRRSEKGYYASKAVSVFLFSFLLLTIIFLSNLAVTYILFPSNAPMTEMYTHLIPGEGTFAEILYNYSPFTMAMGYSLLNALTLSIFAVFSFTLQMVFHFKNQYIAVAIPTILLYTITFIFDSVRALRVFDLRIIIQPRSANALEDIITGKDVFITIFLWCVLDIILYVIGRVRNRDIL